MPHTVKPPLPVLLSAQLQLQDRSPVQTPSNTTANSPDLGPVFIPRLDASSYAKDPAAGEAEGVPTRSSSPIPIPPATSSASASSSQRTKALSGLKVYTQRPRIIMAPTMSMRTEPLMAVPPMSLNVPLDIPISEVPDIKNINPMLVSHCDRSPSQTGFNTRANSPSGRAHTGQVKAHDESDAAETMETLRGRFEIVLAQDADEGWVDVGVDLDAEEEKKKH